MSDPLADIGQVPRLPRAAGDDRLCGTGPVTGGYDASSWTPRF